MRSCGERAVAVCVKDCAELMRLPTMRELEMGFLRQELMRERLKVCLNFQGFGQISGRNAGQNLVARVYKSTTQL